MPRPSIREVLEALRRAPTLEAAASQLGMPPERLRLYAAGLAASGLARLQTLNPGECDCSACPLAGLCGAPRPRARGGGGLGARRGRAG